MGAFFASMWVRGILVGATTFYAGNVLGTAGYSAPGAKRLAAALAR